jgi:hypothetical protein
MQNPIPNRALIPLVAFTLAYFMAGIILILVRQDYEFLVYLGVMAAVTALILHVHRRVNLVLASLWGMSVWGLLHLAGGLVAVPADWPVSGSQVLYSWWLIPRFLKFDNIVHAYGFGLATWICWQGLAASLHSQNQPARPTVGRLTLAAAAGQGFGALNEVLEFIVTLVVPNTNVGGYVNTGWDLVCNLLGSLLAVLLIAWQARAPGIWIFKSNRKGVS